MRVAVTGNIGSGKTLFSHALANSIIPVIDADREGKQLLNKYRTEIFEMLNLSLSDNYIETLKAAIIKDRDLFDTYNTWMGKRLPDIVTRKAMAEECVIVVCALIYEWGIDSIFDRIIFIDGGSIDSRESRKTGMSKAMIELLESHQMPAGKKAALSDITILNKDSKEELIEKAVQLHSDLFADCSISQ